MKIFLIGMPGSGKSTIGRLLALKLDIPFIDLDHEIEKKEGRLIKDIFSAEGEAYFRQVESNTLTELASSPSDYILATGGGAPCFHDGIAVINKHGISVFLDVTVDELVSRVENNKDRPLLQAADRDALADRLQNIRSARIEIYKQAHLINTNSDVDTVISQIKPLLLKT